MKENILITCSQKGCPRKRIVPRETDDPPRAVRMAILCPWHQNSEFEEPAYFDKYDKEILIYGYK